MSISKQIIERHGGEIDYVSELGKGSTFFIVLKELTGAATTDTAPDQQALAAE